MVATWPPYSMKKSLKGTARNSVSTLPLVAAKQTPSVKPCEVRAEVSAGGPRTERGGVQRDAHESHKAHLG